MKNNNCLKNLKAPLKTCLRANHIKRTFVSKVFFSKIIHYVARAPIWGATELCDLIGKFSLGFIGVRTVRMRQTVRAPFGSICTKIEIALKTYP